MESFGSLVSSEQARKRAGGAVLAEFALLGFVVWLLLAGVLEIGRALTAQQLIQHAARTMAREVALLELPADLPLEAALPNVLDPGFLVIDSDLLARCGVPDFGNPGHQAGLDTLFAGRPIGNQLLRPLMIADRRGADRMIRYPGALLLRAGVSATGCEDGSRYGVGIAQLDAASGAVTWRDVVEREEGSALAGTAGRGFALEDGGWVSLRVNYPFQSAGLLAARSTGATDPITGRALQTLVEADGVAAGPPPGAGLAPSTEEGGVYAGPLGLGRLYSIPDATGASRPVRPYRRLLSAQAGFRREVFLAASGGTP